MDSDLFECEAQMSVGVLGFSGSERQPCWFSNRLTAGRCGSKWPMSLLQSCVQCYVYVSDFTVARAMRSVAVKTLKKTGKRFVLQKFFVVLMTSVAQFAKTLTGSAVFYSQPPSQFPVWRSAGGLGEGVGDQGSTSIDVPWRVNQCTSDH